MPDNTNDNSEDDNIEQPALELVDIVGSKLTIRQAQDKVTAAENLEDVLGHLNGVSPLSVKAKLFAMLKRLADVGTLRMPKQFNKEATLGNKKHFYAIKPHKNIRAYGWFSSLYAGVFFISHYKYKNKQKLDPADTKRVKRMWREVDNG